jgi:hypothetical protein
MWTVYVIPHLIIFERRYLIVSFPWLCVSFCSLKARHLFFPSNLDPQISLMRLDPSSQ